MIEEAPAATTHISIKRQSGQKIEDMDVSPIANSPELEEEEFKHFESGITGAFGEEWLLDDV